MFRVLKLDAQSINTKYAPKLFQLRSPRVGVEPRMDENGNRTEDKRHRNPGDSDIDTFLQYGRYQALRVWGLGSIIGKETRQFFFHNSRTIDPFDLKSAQPSRAPSPTPTLSSCWLTPRAGAAWTRAGLSAGRMLQVTTT